MESARLLLLMPPGPNIAVAEREFPTRASLTPSISFARPWKTLGNAVGNKRILLELGSEFSVTFSKRKTSVDTASKASVLEYINDGPSFSLRLQVGIVTRTNLTLRQVLSVPAKYLCPIAVEVKPASYGKRNITIKCLTCICQLYFMM